MTLELTAELTILQAILFHEINLCDTAGLVRPEFFLLVDLRDFFSDLGSGGRKK